MPEIQVRGGALDGLAIHYLARGRGPTVVLVHGLGGFAESWRHNVEYLAERARVLAVDLPGFGRSAKPRAGYDLEFFADALRGFVRALGLDRVALVGHSLGGAVALTYALGRPGAVERVALIGGVVPGFGYRPSWVYRLLSVHGLGEIAAAWATPAMYRAAVARCFAEPAAGEVAFLVNHAYAARTGPEGRAAYLATLRGVRTEFVTHGAVYRAALARLDVPVLAIHGRQDPIVPPAHCLAVVGGLGRGTVRWLDRCGHFPQIERAPAVNALLADFLVGRAAAR